MIVKKHMLSFLIATSLLLGACSPSADADESGATESYLGTETTTESTEVKEEDSSEVASSNQTEDTKEQSVKESQTEEVASEEPIDDYKTISVDGGDLSGHREPNVRVNIGFDDREYWGFTNEYGQLVRVTADAIVLQDDTTEPIKSNGRYYHDEAKVPGVENSNFDEGHVIADSLGGVSNAYNITPQDSILNRHGDQAYMERNIRQAGGATNFEAIITYPDTETQIPSKYRFTYTILGNDVVDEFQNGNPDEYNKEQGLTTSESTESEPSPESSIVEPEKPSGDISSIDTNNNGMVTIKEAKDAGFSMPITKDHWLYIYMRDNDGDGMVGE
ncbi:DNA/RNA non-specific endonuclease [Carnobacterium viridans]|uniref:DNA/RNA non-specific endonuclease n=1 Tax=Carnobacterium viridans TaxID=174587 RepID=A0A1H0XI83_9LACT|nr:DNA/RNA non-specific endonuclease [Carnobacterium viridans]SDQ02505.1 DNA/RNA non-specific endonuclease [Carnobacterium viridans]SDQ02545.1 DNA/RNA non-specific endonuclease [Carnobacterium viridans]